MAKRYLQRRRTRDVPHQLVVTFVAVAVALNSWLHMGTCGVEAKLGVVHAQSWMATSQSVFVQSRTLQEQAGEESDDAEESSEGDDEDEGSDSEDNEEAKTLTEQCIVVTECEMCFRGERSKEPGCSPTGRRQKLECVISSSEGREKRRVPKFESCKRTNADEEFLFILIMPSFATAVHFLPLASNADITSNEMEPLTPAASSEVEMV
eukprot:scaffold62116_cov45-Attheya_sp.AAC.2